jgi:signal transduction histidine kinase/ActR/RegA family two-component response regulator
VAATLAQSRTLDGAPDIDAASLASFEELARRAMSRWGGWVELSDGERVLLDTRRPVGEQEPRAVAKQTEGLIDTPDIRPLQAGGGPLYAAVVHPVQRGGRPLLNLTVTMLPGELQRIIGEQNLPPGRIGTVLDSQGTVVARHPRGERFVGHSVTPDLREHLATRSEGLFESVSLDGLPTIGYFSTSAQGWTYISAMERPPTIGSLPTVALQGAAGAALLLLLAGFGAVWVSRGIGDAVVSLKDDAVRMKAGRPLVPRVTGIAECDAVADALAEAAASIRAGQTELESQVADAIARTRVVEQRVAQGQRLEALGRLTGGVAHDFNNLLGVISNSAHMLERHAASNDALRLPVAATLRAVDAGSRLTQHLQRIAGSRVLQPQRLHLGRHLPELQDLLASVLGKTIGLAVDVEPDTEPVTVDPSELDLTLLNLALNARDAMPRGGQVWLRARNADSQDFIGLPEARYVVVIVSDDGVGIDAEMAAHVFEPFFTSKAVGKGTGLGLSQVHGFCLQSGGIARIGSTPGLGTAVTLVLPASVDAPPAAPAPPGTDNPAQQAADGSRVLLVEDNPELSAVTLALLASYGYIVESVGDADTALQTLQAGAVFDVVLSDIVMPGNLDGLMLARKLRQDSPLLPVVLMSGYSKAAASADEFTVLRKPCEPVELLKALRAAMVATVAPPGPTA